MTVGWQGTCGTQLESDNIVDGGNLALLEVPKRLYVGSG